MDLGNLNWSVEVDTSDLSRAESEMEGTRAAATGAKRGVESIGEGAERAGRRTRTASQRMERDMQRVRRSTDMLRQAVGGLVAALGVREITRYADAWQSVENQLRMVTSSTREMERVQSQVVTVARETRASFSATGNLYARLARSTTELGLAQSDLLSLTRTINQSFAVSGATAEEASAAITQLSQGLAAGALRGDEFNSVAEQAPAIMRAISESLGMTIGDLRDFAAEGGITAEIVVNALQEASGSIAEDFAGSIATFGQQLEVARTNMIEWAGESSVVRDAIAGVGNALINVTGTLSANTGAINAAMGAAGGAAAAYISLQVALVSATVAQRALNAAMRVNPFIAAASAIAAVTGALYASRDATIELGDTQATLAEWMQGTWKTVSDGVSDAVGGAMADAGNFFGEFGDRVGEVAQYMWGTFEALLGNIVRYAKVVVNSVIGYFLTLRDTMGIVATTIRDQFRKAFENVLDIAAAFWEDLKGVFSGDLDFSSFRGAVRDGIIAPLEGAAEEIQAAFRENFSVDYVGESIMFMGDAIEGFKEDVVSNVRVAGMEFKTLDEWLLKAGDTASKVTDPALSDLGDSTSETASEVASLSDELQALRRRLQPGYADAERFARGLNTVNLALAAGRISMGEYAELVQMLQREMQGADDDIRGLGDTNAETTDEMSREWERFGNSVDETFKDAFKGAFDSFEDFADQLKNAFENLLAELAYAAIKNEIKIQLGMQGSGPMQGGISDIFGGGTGGIGGMINGAKSLFGFGSSTGGAASLGMQGGVSGTAITSANQVAAGSQGWMASASQMAPQVAALYAIQQAGDSLLEGIGAYEALGIDTSGQAAQIGGQLLGPGGKILGSGLDALFGSDSPAYKGVVATIDEAALSMEEVTKALDAAGGNFEAVAEEFGINQTRDLRNLMKDGGEGHGYFERGGNEEYYEVGAFGAVGFRDRTTRDLGKGGDEGWWDQVTQAAAAIDNAVASFAQSESEFEAMKDAVQAVEVYAENSRDLVEAFTQTRPEAAIEAMDSAFGEFLQNLDGSIEQVIARGQQAVAAFDLMSGSVERLSLDMDMASEEAILHADNMAQMAGGAQNLAAAQQGYYQAVYSETERLTHQQSDLAFALQGVTDTVPTTVAELRSMVEAADLNTEAGRELALGLMQLAPAFAQTTDSVKQAITEAYQADLGRAPEAEGLAYWMDQVSSGSINLNQALELIAEASEDATQNLDSLRQAVLDAVDAEKEQLRAQRDAQVAMEKASIDALRSQRQTVQSEAQAMMDAEKERFDSVRTRLQEAMDAERESHAARLGMLQEQRGAVADAVSAGEAAVSSLRDALEQLGVGTVEEQRMRRSTAVAELAGMRGGNINQERMDRSLGVVTQDSRGQFETFESFAFDQARTANIIADLEEEASAQLTIDQQQLNALDQQIVSANQHHDQRMLALESQMEAEQARHDKTMSAMQSQLEVAQKQINDDIARHEQNIELINRDYEAEISRLDSIIMWAKEETRVTESVAEAVRALSGAMGDEGGEVPGFANGGIHSGGWRVVGERGPELEYTGPSQIMSNSESRGMLSDADTAEEVRMLRRDLRESQYRIAKNTRQMTKMIERWDGEGLPMERDEAPL